MVVNPYMMDDEEYTSSFNPYTDEDRTEDNPYIDIEFLPEDPDAGLNTFQRLGKAGKQFYQSIGKGAGSAMTGTAVHLEQTPRFTGLTPSNPAMVMAGPMPIGVYEKQKELLGITKENMFDPVGPSEITRGLRKAAEPYKVDKGRPLGFFSDVLNGMAEFVPSMAVSAVDPGTGFVLTFETIAGSKYDQYIQEGKDEQTAKDAALLSAMLTAPVEQAGNMIQIRSLGNILKKAGDKTGLSKRFRQYIMTLVQNSLAEGGEELIQENLDIIADQYANNPDMAPAELAKNVWNDFLSVENLERSGKAFAGGVTGGFILSGTGVGLRMTQDVIDRKKAGTADTGAGDLYNTVKQAYNEGKADIAGLKALQEDKRTPKEMKDAIDKFISDIKNEAQKQAEAQRGATPTDMLEPTRLPADVKTGALGLDMEIPGIPPLSGKSAAASASLLARADEKAGVMERQVDKIRRSPEGLSMLKADLAAQDPYLVEIADRLLAGEKINLEGLNEQDYRSLQLLVPQEILNQIPGEGSPAPMRQEYALAAPPPSMEEIMAPRGLLMEEQKKLPAPEPGLVERPSPEFGPEENPYMQFAPTRRGPISQPSGETIPMGILSKGDNPSDYTMKELKKIAVDRNIDIPKGMLKKSDVMEVIRNAETIRRDEGQIRQPRNVIEGGEKEGGQNIQLTEEERTKDRNEKLGLIEEAAAETELNPTEAQIEAENYKKGKVKLEPGIVMSIENPKGSTRTGVDKSGNQWESKLNHHYGQILGFKNTDGDLMDVFVGDNPEADNVYIVNQIDPDTGKFDEFKIMYGFESKESARKGYLDNYEKGWKGLDKIETLSKDNLKPWLEKVNYLSKTEKAQVTDKTKEIYAPRETLEIPDINSTGEAVEFSKIATPEQLSEVKKLEAQYEKESAELRNKAKKSVKKAEKMDLLNQAMDKATKSQFMREVLEAKENPERFERKETKILYPEQKKTGEYLDLEGEKDTEPTELKSKISKPKKPRLAENESDLWKAINEKTDKGVVSKSGKILYPVVRVVGEGEFRVSSKGIEKVENGGMTVRDATKAEITELEDAIRTDTADVILKSNWGGAGRDVSSKNVEILHSASGNSFKNRYLDLEGGKETPEPKSPILFEEKDVTESEKATGEFKEALGTKTAINLNPSDIVGNINNKNKIYEFLIDETGSGPFDGGCIVCSMALQKKLGGDIYVLEREDGTADHSVLKVDNKFYDFDGSADSASDIINRFNENENANTVNVRPIEKDDLKEASRNAVTADLLSKMILPSQKPKFAPQSTKKTGAPKVVPESERTEKPIKRSEALEEKEITEKKPLQVEEGEKKFSVENLTEKQLKKLSNTRKVHIHKAFPGSKVEEIPYQHADETEIHYGFMVTLPNGLKVLIDPSLDKIEFNAENIAKDYNVSPDQLKKMQEQGKARLRGFYTQTRGIGMIGLLSTTGPSTLSHEKFHFLFDMALNNSDRESILKRYKTEEKAAEAFRKREGFTRTFWEKIQRILSRIKDAIYGDVFKPVFEGLQGKKAQKAGTGEIKYSLETEKGKDINEKETILKNRKKNEDLLNYLLAENKKQTGKEGMTIDKESEGVVKYFTPGLERILEPVKEIKQGVESLVLPTNKSPEHLRAAEVLGTALGRMGRDAEIVAHDLLGISKTFEKLKVSNPNIELENNAGIKFMSDMSTGREMTSEMQHIKDKIDYYFEDRLKKLEQAGVPIKTIRENYFPGMWTQESRRAFNQAIAETIEENTLVTDDIRKWTKEQKNQVRKRVDELLRKGQGADTNGLEYLSKRPFKGKESFRKQKVFEDIMGGIEFGLKPVSNNPIDLVSLKLAEMDRSIMANRAINEWKKSGDIQFLKSGRNMPGGFAKIDDKYGTVYGPPEVLTEEYVDRNILNALSETAKNLNIPHNREIKVGRSRIGEYSNLEGIKTQFATELSVFGHEIGHALDTKYDLWDKIVSKATGIGKKGKVTKAASQKARGAIQNELRALADLTWEGTTPTEGFKKKVRTKAEKIAHILEAYTQAPERLMDVAPNVHKTFENFLKEIPALKPLLDMKSGISYEKLSNKIDIGGFPVIGQWIAKKPTADILNNYLSSSIYNNKYFGKAFKVYMNTANLLNQFQLGIGSAFHAGFTSFEVTISQTAETIKNIYGLIQGNRTAADVLNSAKRIPAGFILNPMEGNKIIKEWVSPTIDVSEDQKISDLPHDNATRIAMITKAAELAGGGFKMERGLRTDFMKTLMKNINSGKRGKVKLVLESPVLFSEILAKPIMDMLVPRQKAGIFGELAGRIIEMNPDKSLKELTPEFRQAWNRVDARLGQVRYNRLFINNAAKNAIQALIRAPGWTGGTIAEIGGSIKDTGKFLASWARDGKMPENIPDRAAYTIALFAMVSVLNGLLTYLFTGETPEGKDYWAFRTGGTDEYGRPERMLLPTYMKDVWAYSRNPGQVILHKTHPLIGVIGDIAQNQDYYGVKVYNEEDPLIVRQIDKGEYVLKQFTPFWIRGAKKEIERGGGLLKTMKEAPQKIVSPLLGIMPAPSTYVRSEFEDWAYRLSREQNRGSRTKKQFEKSRLKIQLETAIRRGDENARENIDEAFRKGKISRRDRKDILDKSKEDPIERAAKRMSLDNLVYGLQYINKDELKIIVPVFRTKLTNKIKSGTIKKEDRDRYSEILKSLEASLK